MDSAKSRAYRSFTTGMDVMLLPCCSLHMTSVYLLNVCRLIRCSGLLFFGGEWGGDPGGKKVLVKVVWLFSGLKLEENRLLY